MEIASAIDIKQNIISFHEQIVNDPNHRFRSWEHCYSHFQKRKTFKNDSDLDTASLHLAFYLASWGMYRGSSFLLQKDYRVHTPVVRELLKEKYERLWAVDFDAIEDDAPETDTVFELTKNIREIYTKNVTTVGGKSKTVVASDILVTKIVLGTMGCIPAYDRLFKKGVNLVGDFPARLGKNSYRGLIKFYRNNASDIKSTQATISQYGVTYPPMKLIDMYFWNIGYIVLGGEVDDEE